MTTDFVIGIDLGGSSAKAVLAKADGEMLAKANVAFDPAVPMGWLEAVRTALRSLQEDLRAKHAPMGLSAPGLAAVDGRSIAFMPGRLAGLEGLDWTTALGAKHPVPVLNDAHAALLAEVWVGAARGCRNVAMLTLGTGVGGAAMVDGHLLRGAIGRAGHFGHMSLDPRLPADICGSPGSLEFCMGNYSIGERSINAFATTHDLIDAYNLGDQRAAEIWLASVDALARGLTSIINVIDPEVILLGGGIARAGAALFGPLEARLRPIEWAAGGHQVPLKPATLGEYAGAIGAAHNALQQAAAT